MIVYLNGSINAGKSTLAAMLAAAIARMVNIEVDHLRHFADCLTLEEAIPYALEDSILLTRQWVNRGFHVVVASPISNDDYAAFAAGVADLAVPLFAFTLVPRQEIVSKSRGSRELTEWERKRIAVQYHNDIDHCNFGVRLDNSDETPAETLARIMAHLGG